MKHIFKIFSFLAVAIVVISCESDYVPPYESAPKGGFVRFDEPVVAVIDFTALETSAFTNTLVATSSNISAMNLSVSLQKSDSTYDTVALRVINEFPNSLSISAQQVVDAYAGAVTFADFEAGDRINVVSTATRDDGTVFTTADFTGDLANPGQRQAFDYTIFFSCPFVPADALGSYVLTNDGFGGTPLYPAGTLVDGIAGSDENGVTLVDIFGHGFDVEVVTDPNSGIATIAKQPAFDTDDIGLGFGVAQIEGAGFFFSCTGFLTVDVEVTVAAGSFGIANYQFQRQ